MSYDGGPKTSVLSPLNDHTRMSMVPLKLLYGSSKVAMCSQSSPGETVMHRHLTSENPCLRWRAGITPP